MLGKINNPHSTAFSQLVLVRLGSSKICTAAPTEQPIATRAQEHIPSPTKRMNNSRLGVRSTMQEPHQVSVYIDGSSLVNYVGRAHMMMRLAHCRVYLIQVLSMLNAVARKVQPRGPTIQQLIPALPEPLTTEPHRYNILSSVHGLDFTADIFNNHTTTYLTLQRCNR